MNYIDIINAYMQNQMSKADAEYRLWELREMHFSNNNIKEMFRVDQCLTLIKRTEQYNNHTIECKDYLLFIKDFVRYISSFKLKPFIVSLLKNRKELLETGVSFDNNGNVYVNFDYPSWFDKNNNNRKFIDEVYSLRCTGKKGIKCAVGDNLLRKNTVYRDYRSIEQKIAAHIAIGMLPDYSMLISLPTGGGKSLITQLLGAACDKLTLVIVPSIVLAHDQFLQVQKALIDNEVKNNTYYYTGELKAEEKAKILESIENQTARIIFTSPEAVIRNDKFHGLLLSAAQNHYLYNIVIDEAHVIPDWGVYFRPDFQIFSVELKELRKISDGFIRTYLLSATLEDKVVEILKYLFVEEERFVEYRCDALREEPRYIFKEFKSVVERTEAVLDMIYILPKPMVIYVHNPEQANYFQYRIKNNGFSNIRVYTGETSDKVRREILLAWKNNDIDIVIGTSAFGMGVDKANVRTVIHACVPESMSRFYQEVGRAGRDGIASLSVFFPFTGADVDSSDIYKTSKFVNGNIMTINKILPRWNALIDEKNRTYKNGIFKVNLSAKPRTLISNNADTESGGFNLNWNVNLMLMLNRQKLIDIIKADYYDDTFYFSFKLLDEKLLTEINRVEILLKEPREKEIADQKSGLESMKDLISHSSKICWGDRLLELFPLAECACSGCPKHFSPNIATDDMLQIRKNVNIAKVEECYEWCDFIGVYDTIVLENRNDISLEDSLTLLDKLNPGVIVVPDECVIKCTLNTLVVDFDTFEELKEIIPNLFSSGVVMVFDDNQSKNNKRYISLFSDKVATFRKILFCDETMYISSEGKRLIDCPIDFRTKDIENLTV